MSVIALQLTDSRGGPVVIMTSAIKAVIDLSPNVQSQFARTRIDTIDGDAYTVDESVSDIVAALRGDGRAAPSRIRAIESVEPPLEYLNKMHGEG